MNLLSRQKINEIVKHENAWGEDPQLSLAKAKSGKDTTLICELEIEVENFYRRRIREEFTREAEIKNILIQDSNIESKFKQIAEILTFNRPYDHQNIFEKILKELIDEDQRLRSLPAQNYLIHKNSGKLMFPITEGMIVAGKNQSILHPSISSTLALIEQEKSYEYIDITLIKSNAEKILYSRGFSKGTGLNFEIIKFGVENDTPNSKNKRFDRNQTYSHVLANRISKIISSGFNIEKIEKLTDSKERWLLATVNFP